MPQSLVFTIRPPSAGPNSLGFSELWFKVILCNNYLFANTGVGRDARANGIADQPFRLTPAGRPNHEPPQWRLRVVGEPVAFTEPPRGSVKAKEP